MIYNWCHPLKILKKKTIFQVFNTVLIEKSNKTFQNPNLGHLTTIWNCISTKSYPNSHQNWNYWTYLFIFNKNGTEPVAYRACTTITTSIIHRRHGSKWEISFECAFISTKWIIQLYFSLQALLYYIIWFAKPKLARKTIQISNYVGMIVV